MSRFLYGSQLYLTLQQEVKATRDILWICTPQLSQDAHEILPQEITQNTPTDTRIILKLNDTTTKTGEVNPYETQFLLEHLKNSTIKTLDNLNTSIYAFDNTALVTTAALTKTAFETNIETGILLEDQEAEQAKKFFHNLWINAKPIKDTKKHKKTYKPPTTKTKGKPHTTIKKWNDTGIATWYFATLYEPKKRTTQTIIKEANWPNNQTFVCDIGPKAYKQLKLYDLAWIADLTKKTQPTIKLQQARIFDKARILTADGDLHVAYNTQKSHMIGKNRFLQMLQDIGLGPKYTDILLTPEQIVQIMQALLPTKNKLPKPTVQPGTAENKQANKKTLTKTNKKKQKKKNKLTKLTKDTTKTSTTDKKKKLPKKPNKPKPQKQKASPDKNGSTPKTDIIVAAPQLRKTDK